MFDMDEEFESTQCTQNTQDVVDPRRMGLNSSGLSSDDVADVMLILHPTTPAAFDLIQETARRNPQHILQDIYPARRQQQQDEQFSQGLLEEDDTFILGTSRPGQALDLAFRFSSKLTQPHLGFTFGRNPHMSDITVPSDAHKRVSNMHFVIYMNDQGVVMLKDTSTNGTCVDGVLLKAKNGAHPKTRMLGNHSIIQILSLEPNEELKFMVRIPSRQGYVEEYQRRAQKWLDHQAEAEFLHRQENGEEPLLAPPKLRDRAQQQTVRAPMHNQYGMHWDGGDLYNIVGNIGKGAFATVYQLATKSDGQLFAAKELEKRRFMKNGVLDRKLENEMLIMQSIDHKSVVQYHGYQDAGQYLYILMEFVPCGDLQQHLLEHGALPETMAQQMALQVFDALDYLHHKKITHRDIKPDNILIANRDEENFIVKLSDFGLSKAVNDNDTFLKTFCGTLLYCAPEVFPHYEGHVGTHGTKRPRRTSQQQQQQQKQQQSNRFHCYSQAVDVWSFGAVLWYSLCLKPPFEGVADNTGRAMFDKIMMTALEVKDLDKQGVSADAIELLVSMLNTEPLARPLPADCMRTKWLGYSEPPVRQHVELGAIAEEAEGEQEPNVAGLSLQEQQSSQYSEISLDSADMNFFDPRASKRFKIDDDRNDDADDLLNSSGELLETIPIMHDEMARLAQPAVKPPKLFGEISRSDLQSVAVDRAPKDVANDSFSRASDLGQSHQDAQRKAEYFNPRRADSLATEGKMDSPFSNVSDDADGNDPLPPKTSVNLENRSPSTPSQQTPAAVQFVTSKRALSAAFDRQIKIGIPPSYYYDPADPSTHTLEYASKVSGHDFVTDPLYMPKEPSLPVTASDSARSSAPVSLLAGNDVVSLIEQGTATPPAVFGRLVSTSDSFANVTIDLNERFTSWGRQTDNTHIYSDGKDTRVPKYGMHLFIHAVGIDSVPEGESLTDLPGLYCGILTYASNGLHINGVHLKKADPENVSYGKLHTGDEIEICSPPRGNQSGLKFVVELYHGEGKIPRTRNSRFKIEMGNPPSSQQGKSKRRKSQEKQADPGAEIEEIL